MSTLAPRRTTAIASAALLCASVGSVGSTAELGARPAGVPQAEPAAAHYLPNLQYPSCTLASSQSSDLLGMVGFGDSSIELQNCAAGDENDVAIRIQKAFESDVLLSRHLDPGAAAAVRLAEQPDLTYGRFSAVIRGQGPLGILARTGWSGGSATAYEAPVADCALVLPFMVRMVDSDTTIFLIQNADETQPSNNVHVEVFDNDAGDSLVDLTAQMPRAAVYAYDTVIERGIFGSLPDNAEGGFVGSVRFAADSPMAVMAYGDEMKGDATSAYVARPIAAASTYQYLPDLRANQLGDSLIAIANIGQARSVAVTVTYRAHVQDSGSAPGESYSQSLRIAARGTAFIDLADRGRGAEPPPDLPRGRHLNEGFAGSAIIRASGPVLAAVQNEARAGNVVHTAAAYNAFGPNDLGAAFAVPQALGRALGRRTQLAFMNPGRDRADVAITFRNENGEQVGYLELSLPAGASHILDASQQAPSSHAMAIVATKPLAVLVSETTLLAAKDWGHWGLDTLTYPAVRMAGGIPTEPPPTANRHGYGQSGADGHRLPARDANAHRPTRRAPHAKRHPDAQRHATAARPALHAVVG